ncbi:MAG: hypothetical protein ACLPX8_20950 [Bryobacteraceae bacterium]
MPQGSHREGEPRGDWFFDEALPGRRQTASQIAGFNNRREAPWGVSPRDRQAVLAAFHARPFVMFIGGHIALPSC